jgi:hypothetical protein
MGADAFLEELRAKEQIRDAMARYARGIDRRDEDLVRSAYHPDSIDNHGFGLSAGGWDIAALVRRDGRGFPDEWKHTTHFLGQHLIEVDGDAARSEVYFLAYTRAEDPDGVDWDQLSAGRYLDRWERRDGEFKIAARTVVYDWLRTDPARTPWPGPDHDVPKMYFGGAPLDAAASTFGVPGPDDASYALFGAAAPATA